MADQSPFTLFHNQLLLAHHLRHAKPAIDTAPPKAPYRLALRNTKAAKVREQDRIDANQKLAKRMIEMCVQVEKQRPTRAHSVKSLNAASRLKREKEIAQENWQLTKGLKAVRSSVDRGEMKKFAGRCQRYRKLIAAFQHGVCRKDPMRPAMTPELKRRIQHFSDGQESPASICYTHRALHRSKSHASGRIPKAPVYRCDSGPVTSR